MKKQVVFVHGGDSFTKKEDFFQHLRTMPLRSLPGKESPLHWTQTLVADLGEEYDVFMLSMPNKQNADFEEWSIWFERHFEYLRDGVVLVGWSLGGMFLAKYLSEKQTPFTAERLFLFFAPRAGDSSPPRNECWK